MNNYILEVNQLRKTFTSGSKELTVLKHITFNIESGTSCAIVGPSGSGKTTLLGLCAGLDQPTEGSVILKGQNISAMDESDLSEVRNRQIGFVFQSFQLISTLTALENVMVPIELRGTPYREVEQKAINLLTEVGLADRLDHYPNQLSGGEQQRVSMARALMNNPSIILADEPTGNLDEQNTEIILDLLFELRETEQVTLVLITHEKEIANRCDTLYSLQSGVLEKEN